MSYQTKTTDAHRPAGLISQALLAKFSSKTTEKTVYGSQDVVFHTIYEIWTFADGKGGNYENLYITTTRNGIHCGGGLEGGYHAKRGIEEVRKQIRRVVEFVSKTDTSLYVRFIDVHRSINDLPEIFHDTKTWVPYAGTREPDGNVPGYYVEYKVKESVAISALGRVGKTNGDVITF